VKQAKKAQRQELLREILSNNPFYTDEQLAAELSVSVQTIRLDRICLAIPELRERVKTMAASARVKLKSIDSRGIVGELIDIEPGASGISVMRVSPDMTVGKDGVARGHYMFAQANTLALAIINAPAALTGVANIKYLKPAYGDERLVAKAQVIRQRGSKYFIWVKIRNDRYEVFRAKFIVLSLAGGEGNAK
jgi:acyl-coenzyme A thioesterase PaaI-like protein